MPSCTFRQLENSSACLNQILEGEGLLCYHSVVGPQVICAGLAKVRWMADTPTGNHVNAQSLWSVPCAPHNFTSVRIASGITDLDY